MLEEHWHSLSGSEQKVLDFILRQTLGFKKRCDFIALKQFSKGLGGRSKNKGTGLSISQVRRAIVGLEEKGFILVTRIRNCPSNFCLLLEHDPVAFLTGDPKGVLVLPRKSKKR